MATIINNPPQSQYRRSDTIDHAVVERDTNSGVGFLFGIILAILLAVLLFAYGLPYLRSVTDGGNNVNVPERIQLDVNGSTPSSGGTGGTDSGSGSAF
jgi:hypothetical protein